MSSGEISSMRYERMIVLSEELAVLMGIAGHIFLVQIEYSADIDEGWAEPSSWERRFR